MKLTKLIKSAVVFVSLSLCLGQAQAGMINGSLNVDNEFFAYISTADDVAGILVAQGNDWTDTKNFSFDLDDGKDYFLHIHAIDRGVVAGLLGQFSLTGTDHSFANGLTQIYSDDVNWMASTSGWNNYQLATAYAFNGGGLWGNRASGIDSGAQWIWSSVNNVNGQIDQNVYFSLAINSASANRNAQVPEPSTLAIFALAMLGLAGRRARR